MIAPTLSNLTGTMPPSPAWPPSSVMGEGYASGRKGQSAMAVCCTIPRSSEGWETQPDTVFLAYIATGTGRLAGLMRAD